MKKISVTLLVVLFVLGSLPVFAKTDSRLGNPALTGKINYHRDYYRLRGNYRQTFTRSVNRGHVDILISGDGTTDLDLYVYIGDEILSSESYSDDEKICVKVGKSGYIKIVVINRGYFANDYQLIIK